jgi:sulfatase modifying factor 1
MTITSPFYLGRYEVTQEQWIRTIGRNPSTIGPPNPQERVKKLTAQWMDEGMTRAEAVDAAKRKEESDRTEHERNQPVDGVTWRSCAEFCRVSDLRLPTEAEWEYAYRAGTTASLHGFPGYLEGTDDAGLLANIAWYSGSSTVRSRKEPGYGRVGTKWANGLGVHDMAGNVSEWVSDWYQGDYYAQSPKRDPGGPSEGRARVVRGGDRESGPYNCAAWARRSEDPESESRVELIGLRVAKDP